VLPSTSIAKCEERWRQIHTGLPRALLGRHLETPSADVSSNCIAKAMQHDTPYARWERLRSTLLRRISTRGQFAFAQFRKALAARSPMSVTDSDSEMSTLVRPPEAEEIRASSECCLVPAFQVVSILRHDYGVQSGSEELALLSAVFGVKLERSASQEEHRRYRDFAARNDCIDPDDFADSVRGEASPGRHKCLRLLYTQLQLEAGVGADSSLERHWVEDHLSQVVLAGPAKKRLADGGASAAQHLTGLPLLRHHDCITRSDFVRWMADTFFHIPDHQSFLAELQKLWGVPLLRSARHEERNFNLRMRAPSPVPLHHPPFVGGAFSH